MNDELYQNAIQKIECDSKFRPLSCCTGSRVITGPTGPTGPQGPATITIGTTSTGVPGSAATVFNSGTPENNVLNFVIPAGATGPIGATGATGPAGATASCQNFFSSKFPNISPIPSKYILDILDFIII